MPEKDEDTDWLRKSLNEVMTSKGWSCEHWARKAQVAPTTLTRFINRQTKVRLWTFSPADTRIRQRPHPRPEDVSKQRKDEARKTTRTRTATLIQLYETSLRVCQ